MHHGTELSWGAFVGIVASAFLAGAGLKYSWGMRSKERWDGIF